VGLSAMRRAFVVHYDGNATEAAIKAGYSKKTAYSQGQRLLKNVEVARAIEEREKKRDTPLIMDREKRMETLSAIASNPDTAERDRIKSIDVLNKMDGVYLERVEVKQQEAVTFKWQE